MRVIGPYCGLSFARIVSWLVPNEVPAKYYLHKKFELSSSNRF